MRKLLLLITLFFCLVTVQGKIIMKPYLQAVTINSIWVMVECTTKDSVTVNYGLDSTYGSKAKTVIISATTASPVTFVHKIKLTGLAPDTRYYYEARQGVSVSKGASFRSSVLPGTNFRFTWMADMRTGVEVQDSITLRMLAAKSLVSFYGGDLCFNSAYSTWKKEFFRKNQLELISVVPFFNTPGNHEGWSQNAKTFTRNPESASNTQDYYSFDIGDLHVLSINYFVPCDANSPQYKFAKADLAATTRKWKIVICHAPAYGAGGHGENKDIQAMTTNIFEPNHVDLVIAGHSHFYQHNLVNGIHHLIIGAAGGPLHSPEKASYTLLSVKDYNWAIGEVSPEKLTMTVYNASGKTLDKVELEKY
jgi:hypothetical protein